MQTPVENESDLNAAPRVPLCIYHAACADGFGAAWAVREWHLRMERDIEFHAGHYGEAMPDVAGRNVIIVDFSYPRHMMEAIVRQCNHLTVIDHHRTAMDAMEGFAEDWPSAEIVFDMERSGALMAWNYFFPDEEPPKLINHISDRDLWKFELPQTKEIQATVFSHPYNFDVWDMLMSVDTQQLADEGVPLLRNHSKNVNELEKALARKMRIGGYEVMVANAPYLYVSELAGQLAARDCTDAFTTAPFAACYWDTPNGRTFGLRSTKLSGFDVSAIAQQYGGGGHKHASGFRVSRAQALEMEVDLKFSLWQRIKILFKGNLL